MKISFAEFSNFKNLYSGLDKYKVTIDFKDLTNVITVLIGPMGSGKTTILGHLQPWASFGTLDERNSDGTIIEEKDGYKHIIFLDGDDEFDILHKWTWSKDHHSLKSYVKKNGVELNPNGNQSSFKDIIETEMGIDQNFLRLSRLGPNVANLIDMGATERKEFIARMLSDVDMYLAISKDMSDRARAIGAQTQLLSKKFQGVTSSSLTQMKDDSVRLNSDINNLHTQILNMNNEIGILVGENRTLTGDYSLTEYERILDEKKRTISNLTEKRNDLSKSLSDIFSDYASISDVDMDIGKYSALLASTISELDKCKVLKTEAEKKRDELFTLKSSAKSSDYLKNLADNYAIQKSTVEDYRLSLIGFDCKLSAMQIKTLMTDIQMFDSTLNDLIVINTDILEDIFSKGYENALSTSKKQTEILQKRKFKLQMSINNVDYLSRYQVDEELEVPSGCKHYKKCPYYRTHPSVVKSDFGSFSEKQQEINEELESIDIRLNKLAEYPFIINKMKAIKSMYEDLAGRVGYIGALRVDNFKTLVLYNHKWYDYDKITDTLEKCVDKEKMLEIESKLPEMKVELDKFANADLASVSVQYEKAENDLNDMIEMISSKDKAILGYKQTIESLGELRKTLLNKECIEKQIESLNTNILSLIDEVDTMSVNVNKVKSKLVSIDNLRNESQVLIREEDDLRRELNILTTKIIDIENALEEFDNLNKELAIINLIKEASSAKKGIPLIYVRVFLNDCVDIINQLISMVFEDSIEIKEFNITEKDFYVPYYKNGILIDDIKSASQGEKSIISLALSFALIRKGVSKYNILLLDEIDGALYQKDREKFLQILSQQIKAINSEHISTSSESLEKRDVPFKIL